MKIEVQAGLIATGVVVMAALSAILLVFVPEVVLSIAGGVIVSIIVYHLYNSILDDLRRRELDKTES